MSRFCFCKCHNVLFLQFTKSNRYNYPTIYLYTPKTRSLSHFRMKTVIIILVKSLSKKCYTDQVQLTPSCHKIVNIFLAFKNRDSQTNSLLLMLLLFVLLQYKNQISTTLSRWLKSLTICLMVLKSYQEPIGT